MGLIIWEVLYWAVIAAMSLFGLHRYFILFLFYKNKNKTSLPMSKLAELPHVTVQLPIFNEFYVVERLLKAVSELDYPRHLLEIQVLDDSTDDTREQTRQRVDALRQQGFDAHWVHRADRTGFKAGALEAGLSTAKGEFILILDADFVIAPDFLQQTIHHFADERIALVQTRWGHLNRNYSLLTRVQALFLDAHFVLEQTARSRSGRFFNFNGTGGIWRRSSIEDAGGWQHDTLTEDLDLSYRAQLRGWRFIYRDDLVTPGELPVEMNGFKSQQHRWAKGSIQTCKKLLPALWRSNAPLKVKIEGTAHFTGYFVSPLVVFFCLLIQPTLAPAEKHSLQQILFIDIPAFLFTTIPFLVFYLNAQRQLHPKEWTKNIALLPFMVAVGAGVSINNTRAVIEALVGHQSGFIRTPKYGIEKKGQRWTTGRYSPLKSALFILEVGFALYFCGLCAQAIVLKNYAQLPFLLVFLFGFAYVAFQSAIQWFPLAPWNREDTDENKPIPA